MALEKSPLRRLKRIEVAGLFGIYNHDIDLNLEDRVTLLHGPNGVGKTTILKMVDALLTGDVGYFGVVPFGRLSLEFHDGGVLELTAGEAHDGARGVRLTRDGTSEYKSIDLGITHVEVMAARAGYQRDGIGWIDTHEGEWLTDSDVVGRHGGLLAMVALQADRQSIEDRDPEWSREFLGAVDSHFIEVQRLAKLRRSSHRLGSLLSGGSEGNRRQVQAVSRVVECSKELKQTIDDTMTEYGRRAQIFDQSFPQRLLQQRSADDRLSIDDIRARMADLDRRTAELTRIGILDETPTVEFQLVEEMDTSQADVMTLYVADTARKLEVLEDLAKRVQLLLNSLNGKFRHKAMCIDRKFGLAVEGEKGSLPLDSLSSGEQHELILHYDLLFRVQQNTVVLLDEPELSLHIEWQSKFLSDLTQIVELSGFDAIVATHSPHIVGDRDDLMVELSG